MTAEPNPNARAAAARLEAELFARLGLTDHASDQEVEDAHEAIVQFLGTAPHDLRAWSQRQVARTDEAYALLSDPATDLAAEATAHGYILPAASAMALAGASVAGSAAAFPAAARDAYGAGDEFDEFDGTEQTAAHPNVLRSAKPARTRGLNPVMKAIVAGAVAVGIVTIAYVGYSAGQTSVPGINGTPAPDVSAAPAVDAAQVAALMQKIAANPKDIDSLSALGDLYFQVGDYKTAGDWMAKILAVDPKNIPALLGLGAADFNQADAAGAEKQWRAVLAIDPKNQEAYYDLGFMYLSKDPPDMANVTAMWNKVIEIDPTSSVAKTVQTHLASFASASPGAGAASPAASPSATPAASPSASGN